MIALLELTIEGCTVPLRSRYAVEPVLAMARHLHPVEAAGAGGEQAKRRAALEQLQQTWSKLNRPLGGKWWKTREELYDAP